MPANQKATNDEVRTSIWSWRGNVEGSADHLGLTPRNLRKRLDRLGIDINEVRTRSLRGLPPPWSGPVPTGMDPVPSGPIANQGPTGPVTGGGSWEIRRANSSLGIVSPVAAKAEEVPIATVRTRHQPTRMRPDQQDRLRAAKFELMGRYRVETDENAILQQFFEEAFEAWLHSKLTGELP